MIFALVCLLAITGANAQELLMNVPITFSLNGLINYMPSSGGVATQGYSLTVGFNRYSWLGTHATTQESCSPLSPPPITTTPSYYNDPPLRAQESTPAP